MPCIGEYFLSCLSLKEQSDWVSYLLYMPNVFIKIFLLRANYMQKIQFAYCIK
jgi:hypothetical protein